MNAFTKLASAIVALAFLAFAPMGIAWAQVKVTAADPASTTQGTQSLDVTITGSGFDSTANAKFFVSGTSYTGGISVQKTVVKGSRQLVATIDVADLAVVSKFDIEVTLSSGRKGKGTTLFTVQAKSTGPLDPCAAPGLDFPAFMYWAPNGSTARQILVADATGVCSRPIMSIVAANGASFSYPIAGTENVGRIVFIDAGSINWLDFTVNESDNSLIVGQATPIVPSFNVSGHELSPDGTAVYFYEGPGSPEGFARLYKVTIGESQPPQEIYRSMVAGAGFTTLSLSVDNTTLILEENAHFPEHLRVLRISLPCDAAATCTTVLSETSEVASSMWPASNRSGTTVAFTEYLYGFNNCFQVRFMDSATGAPLWSGTQPRYGNALSWLDNQILVNGRAPPDRRGKCVETGFVTLIDPVTGAEKQLTKGYGPDGR